MDNFPLLRLPLIALDLVLSIANDTTRVRLSRCSKKTQSVLALLKKALTYDGMTNQQRASISFSVLVEILLLDKQVGGTNTEELSTNIGKDDYTIYFGWPEMTSLDVRHISDFHKVEGPEETMMIRDVLVPFKFCSREGSTYYIAFFESQFDGFILLLDYFRGTFGSRISDHTIYCDCAGLVPVIQNVDEYIRTNQGFCDALTLRCDLNQDRESFHYVLRNVTEYDCIKISPIGFVPEGFHLTEPITKRELVLYTGSWFTLENLLAARLEKISLRETTFGNLEMQKYLVEWEMGNVSFIKHLECVLKEAGDQQLILSGFDNNATVKKNIKYKEEIAYIPSSAIECAVIIKIFEKDIIMEFYSDVARAEKIYKLY